MKNLGYKPKIPSRYGGTEPEKPRFIYKKDGKLVDWANPNNYYTLKRELENGLSYNEVASKYGETAATIRGGARRHDLKSIATAKRGPGRDLTLKEVSLVKELMTLGCSVHVCAEKMGIPLSTFQRIMRRRPELIESTKAHREKLIDTIVRKYK